MEREEIRIVDMGKIRIMNQVRIKMKRRKLSTRLFQVRILSKEDANKYVTVDGDSDNSDDLVPLSNIPSKSPQPTLPLPRLLLAEHKEPVCVCEAPGADSSHGATPLTMQECVGVPSDQVAGGSILSP